MRHDHLVLDLYEHLAVGGESVVVIEPPMGSKMHDQSVPIPDIWCLDRSYVKPNMRAYEVKVTQADFMSDIRSGKWERYLEFSDRMYFALHESIDWRPHLQHMPVGVIVRGKKGWRTQRAAPLHKQRKPLGERVWMSLLFNRVSAKPDRYERMLAERALLLGAECDELINHRLEAMRRAARDLREAEKTKHQEAQDLAKDYVRKTLSSLGIHTYLGWGEPLPSVEKMAENIMHDALTRCKSELSAAFARNLGAAIERYKVAGETYEKKCEKQE